MNMLFVQLCGPKAIATFYLQHSVVAQCNFCRSRCVQRRNPHIRPCMSMPFLCRGTCFFIKPKRIVFRISKLNRTHGPPALLSAPAACTEAPRSPSEVPVPTDRPSPTSPAAPRPPRPVGDVQSIRVGAVGIWVEMLVF